jgi:lipid-A-disaccharide synthase
LDHAVYRRHSDLPLVDYAFRPLCARAHAALIASGTATLEAALIGLPHVICYVGDHPSATLARHLIRTPHIGLPNIIHGKRVVPEVLQEECEPGRLALRLWQLWQGDRRKRCLEDLLGTRAALGAGGALGRIADWSLALAQGAASRP